MPFPELTALARYLETTSPDDTEEQVLNLDRVRELRAYVSTKHVEEVTGSVEAARILIEILATPTSLVDREEVLGLACRLLSVAEGAVEALSTSPAAATTSPRVQTIHDMVLGEMLIELGYAQRDQVAAGLRMHRKTRMPLGECMLLSGAATPERLLETIRLQERLRGGETSPPLAADSTTDEPVAAPTEKSADTRVAEGEPSDFQASHYLFLGELLLQQGAIAGEQLERAMHRHHLEGVRVGDALLDAGALTEPQLQSGLELQERLRRVAGLECRGLTGA